MSYDDAIQEIRCMGLTPVIADDGCHLEVDGLRLPLGPDPDWRAAVRRGHDWLESLGETAGQEGEALRHRRTRAGFPDLAAFCDYTGLEENHIFETEAGLARPAPVHLRILDWLERGELKRV